MQGQADAVGPRKRLPLCLRPQSLTRFAALVWPALAVGLRRLIDLRHSGEIEWALNGAAPAHHIRQHEIIRGNRRVHFNVR
jgi:hypothetical protein